LVRKSADLFEARTVLLPVTAHMRRSFVVGLLTSVITMAPAHAQRVTRPMPAPEGLVVGRVVDNHGRPVGGAVVATGAAMGVQRAPAGIRAAGAPAPVRVLTGPDGYFVFRGLPLGEVAITATKPGYAEGAYGRRRPGGASQHLTLTHDEPHREIVLSLWKHGAIGGIVTDEIGEPLVGVAIQPFRRTEANGVRRFIPSPGAMTDDRGVYRLANLLPGDYIVAASSRQLAAPLSLARQSRDRPFTPVPGDSLEAVPVPGTASGLQLGESVYGLEPDGATPPPPDNDHLPVYPPTFYPGAGSPLASITVTIRSGEEREGIDLQLRPVRTVRISGALNGPANMLAMRRLRLVAQDNDALERSDPVTSTDARGAFVFPAVPAGQYSLRTTTRAIDWRGEPGRALHWADVPITVGHDDLDDLIVPLHPGLIVSGSVAFDGSSPTPSASGLQQTRIVVERAKSGLPGSDSVATAVVDDIGQFSTPGLPAGSYFVRVTDSPPGWMFKGAMHNGRDLSEHAIEVSDDLAGVTLEFTDRWTGVRGVVTTPTGQIDTAALVLLFPTDSARWRAYTPGARRMRSARVRAGGEFSFGSVPVGEYYVAAIADEDGSDWQDPEFLDAVSRSATRLMIGDGDQKTITIRRRTTRR
jgi:hypothetical protein